MRLRVAVSGSGTREDPLQVNLPTYTMLGDVDPDTGTVIVEVPDADVPPGMVAEAPDHAQWHAHLDSRYIEHAGRFRPQVAGPVVP